MSSPTRTIRPPFRLKRGSKKLKDLYQSVFERDEWTCQGQQCTKQFPLDSAPHHIIFKSQGGSDVEDNLEALCMKCHSKKHGIILRGHHF